MSSSTVARVGAWGWVCGLIANGEASWTRLSGVRRQLKQVVRPQYSERLGPATETCRNKDAARVLVGRGGEVVRAEGLARPRSLGLRDLERATRDMAFAGPPGAKFSTGYGIRTSIIRGQLKDATDFALTSETYRIRVHSGDLRGAGTTESVFIILHGQTGSSGKIDIGNKFERASTTETTVQIPGIIGTIQRLEIGFQNVEGTDTEHKKRGWLLDRIEVELVDSEHTGQAQDPVVFPAMRWVGESDNSGIRSGPEVQVLFPMASEVRYPWRWGAHESPQWNSKIPFNDVVLTACAAATPHPSKVQKGVKGFVSKAFGYAGEDAYIIVSDGPLQLMAVADGVAAWWMEGIDAGEYSRMLVSSLREAAVASVSQAMEDHVDGGLMTEDGDVDHQALGHLDPVQLTSDAWEKVKAQPSVAGSCTACTLTLERSTSTLRAANLGDSGFMVVRIISYEKRSLFAALKTLQSDEDEETALTQHTGKPRLKFPTRYEIVYRSPPREHGLGHPYQLGHHQHTDSPDMADKMELDVREGDWIVMGTDGLFDNLWDDEIASKVLEAHLRMQVDGRPARQAAGETARALLGGAYNRSISKYDSSPFSEAATEELNMAYSGGKPDDITVLVGVVEQGNDELSLGTFRGTTLDFA